MTPKSLLRKPEARSSFDDFVSGTTFQRVLPDVGPASQNAKAVKKLILCTGKVYYDVDKARQDGKAESEIAIARLEQICPFPFDLLLTEFQKYPNAEIQWVQEEPKNMGAWNYVKLRADRILREFIGEQRRVSYAGRNSASSPATGNKHQHLAEQKALLSRAMNTGNLDCRK